MIKEIFYGLLIGGLIIGIAELFRPSHACVQPKEKESHITKGCDTWEMRVSCNVENDWNFRYDKSSL